MERKEVKEIVREVLDEEATRPVVVSQEEKPVRWSWAAFFKGKCSNKFIAFLVSTALVAVTMFTPGILLDAVAQGTLIVIWGIVTIVFMLSGAIDVAVKNMNITAKFTAGKKVNTNTADVIRATRETGR